MPQSDGAVHALLAILVVVLLCAGTAVAARTPGEVRIGGATQGTGVVVGPDDVDRLDDVVVRLAAEVAASPVTLQAGDSVVTTDAGSLGLSVDRPATVEAVRAAVRRPGLSAPASGPTVVPLAVTFDPGAVAGPGLAERLGQPAVDARLGLGRGSVDGSGGPPGLVMVEPERVGQAVDPAALVAQIQAVLVPALRVGPTEAVVTVAVDPVPPRVTADQLAPLAARAEAVADDVVVIVDPADQTPLTQLRGEDVLAWLDVAPAPAVPAGGDGQGADGGPVLVIDPLAVPQEVTASLRQRDRAPADAQIVVDQQVLAGPDRDQPEDPDRFTGTVRVTPDQIGVAVDVAATWAAVLGGAAAGPDTIPAVAAVEQPAVTAEVARDLGVAQPISSFTTFYSAGQSRVTNIHRIAEIVDGATILPGESFELNHFVGERTRDRGFASGGAISGGEFITAVGGGVSQFATTFFNAAWFAGIDLVDFKPHSYYISRYPVGREATIDFPTVNLEVRNDTPHAIVVKTSVTGSSVTVTFWSSPHWTVATDTGPRRRAGSGFRITVTRTRTAPGGAPESTSYTTDYRLQ